MYGFVYKIEKFNVFVVCEYSGFDYDFVFMICCSCIKVVEMDGFLNFEILFVVKSMGFEVEVIVVEVEGFCLMCQEME